MSELTQEERDDLRASAASCAYNMVLHHKKVVALLNMADELEDARDKAAGFEVLMQKMEGSAKLVSRVPYIKAEPTPETITQGENPITSSISYREIYEWRLQLVDSSDIREAILSEARGELEAS